VWDGFFAVEEFAPPEDGSPKLHDQVDGVPREASLNPTGWPASGETGLNEKSAASAAPPPLPARTRRTVRGLWPRMKRLFEGFPATQAWSSLPFTVTIAPT